MPEVELGVNDIVRMGLEVVGRHDILPVPTEQWIRYEDIEFHSIVDKQEFEKNDHIIKYVNVVFLEALAHFDAERISISDFNLRMLVTWKSCVSGSGLQGLGNSRCRQGANSS